MRLCPVPIFSPRVEVVMYMSAGLVSIRRKTIPSISDAILLQTPKPICRIRIRRSVGTCLCMFPLEWGILAVVI